MKKLIYILGFLSIILFSCRETPNPAPKTPPIDEQKPSPSPKT